MEQRTWLSRNVPRSGTTKCLGHTSTSGNAGLWLFSWRASRPSQVHHQWLQSRFRNSGQDDEWNFCLTTAIIAANPTFAAFFYVYGRYYEGDPLTIREFDAFTPSDLPPLK
jgi:hypothetical protein